MIYKGFDSLKVRNNYICKSEISRQALRDMNIPDFISVEDAKKVFDETNDFSRYVITGNSYFKDKQRRTKFLPKLVFYKAIIKDLPCFDKKLK